MIFFGMWCGFDVFSMDLVWISLDLVWISVLLAI